MAIATGSVTRSARSATHARSMTAERPAQASPRTMVTAIRSRRRRYSRRQQAGSADARSGVAATAIEWPLRVGDDLHSHRANCAPRAHRGAPLTSGPCDPDRIDASGWKRAAVKPAVGVDLLEAGPLQKPAPVRRLEPPQVHRRLGIVGPHGQREPARRGVPRRPLPDAGLALEPPVVRRGDVL